MNHRIVVVIPVYNDWQSFQILVSELQKVSLDAQWDLVHVIVINDGSSEHIEDIAFNPKMPVTLLNLNTNMGHQRALSVGLSYLNEQSLDFDCVVVMDSDGEDRPMDIPKLLDTLKSHNNTIVFAKREKRTEGSYFKFFYKVYKLLFKVLTGQYLNFGNFSCIPRDLLPKVVSIPELWNHYSGGIIKSKIPYVSVGTDRGKRYHGTSKMNFQNLILHGLSSIAIYLDVVFTRLLLLAFLSSIFVIIGLLLIVYLALFTSIPIPGWSSLTGLILINILAIVILTTFLILLFQLNQKEIVKFPPKTFYKNFILSISHLKA
jgi:glycosyltransferase involved in cell wall biosynthesis